MKLSHLLVLCCSASFALGANAEIYKRVDDEGHVTYSSAPIKGGKKLHLEPLPIMSSQPSERNNKNGNSDFRINSDTQSRRDNTRRKILEDELATEQKALEEARNKLQEGRDTPEMYKGANGQSFRNVSKYEEKVNALQEEVTSHEKNVEALNKELSNLK